MQTVFSIAIDALAYGMALFIICIGLSLTMGLMRVVNLAHGAFAMIARLYRLLRGARSRRSAMRSAILLAIAGTIVISIPLERLLYRRIYGSPRTDAGADDHRHHLLRHRHHQLFLRPDPEDHPAAGRPVAAGRSRLPHRRRASALRHGLRRRSSLAGSGS